MPKKFQIKPVYQLAKGLNIGNSKRETAAPWRSEQFPTLTSAVLMLFLAPYAYFAETKLNSKDSHVFFCSFPGHAFMMKSTVKLI